MTRTRRWGRTILPSDSSSRRGPALSACAGPGFATGSPRSSAGRPVAPPTTNRRRDPPASRRSKNRSAKSSEVSKAPRSSSTMALCPLFPRRGGAARRSCGRPSAP
ncbi:unnamed protein product [Prorocentrum cordatum]|uniref:Uncharacterized protein n=1 Tax=Prorocentrum cordatum TaxID=2364126 RepID=A0ABN9XJY6_9DINO|nr:unnamed protein product [Polarella glacialis]